jgi:hypothetical protein
MVKYDVLNRSRSAIEGNAGGPFYYVSVLWDGLKPWSLLLPVAVIILLYGIRRYYKNPRSAGPNADHCVCGRQALNTHFCFYLIWISVPLLVFSFAKTKVPWYINPIYPPLAILLAWTIVRLVNVWRAGTDWTYSGALVLTGILFAGLFLTAEDRIVQRIAEHIQSVNPAQTMLYDLSEERYKKGTKLHLVGLSDQSIVFIAKSLKRLQLNSFSDDEFAVLQTKYANDPLIIEVKTRALIASTTATFARTAQAGDLVMLANTDANRFFLASNDLAALSLNNNWIIAGKDVGTEVQGLVFRVPIDCALLDRVPSEIVTPLNINYGNRIRLLGVTAGRMSQNRLKVSYYWQPVRELGIFNSVFVHFSGDDDKILFQGDHAICSPQPFEALRGKVIKETQFIDIPPEGTGKSVRMKIGMYDAISGSYERLKIEAAAGAGKDDNNTRAIVNKLRL